MYSRALVRHMVRHFAALAGWEGDRYEVTQSRFHFDRAAKRYHSDGVDADHELGATLRNYTDDYDPTPLTWISPNIKEFRTLADVCAHEALHAAQPLMPHGRVFERAVRQLLRGEEP